MLSSAMSTGQLRAIYGQFVSQVSQFIRGMLGTVFEGYGIFKELEALF
jgi:hypothetical protein